MYEVKVQTYTTTGVEDTTVELHMSVHVFMLPLQMDDEMMKEEINQPPFIVHYYEQGVCHFLDVSVAKLGLKLDGCKELVCNSALWCMCRSVVLVVLLPINVQVNVYEDYVREGKATPYKRPQKFKAKRYLLELSESEDSDE